jgi:hypothetical protein
VEVRVRDDVVQFDRIEPYVRQRRRRGPGPMMNHVTATATAGNDNYGVVNNISSSPLMAPTANSDSVSKYIPS